MESNTLKSLLQSVATKLTSERDETISKINRLIDSPYDPNINSEEILTNHFKSWAISELGIMKVSESAKMMDNQKAAQEQHKEASQGPDEKDLSHKPKQ